jgi:ribose transport system permease protein
MTGRGEVSDKSTTSTVVAAEATRQRDWTPVIARLAPLGGLLLLMVVMAVFVPGFFTVHNLTNVARQVSINAIIASGMTLIIITAGIDLSVGSLVALTGCVAMLALNATDSDVLGVLIGIAVGGMAGAFNGSLVSFLRLPAFVVTLGGLTIYRGLALTITEGQPIIRFEGAYLWLGQGVMMGLPVPVWIMIVVVICIHFLLSRTTFGAHLYAVGGNETAARLSGVRVQFVKFMAYVIGGLLTGLAGMILMARLSSAQPASGEMFELDAIAAVVLGGTSLSGGRGTVWGTLIGALIIGILNNSLNLLGVSSFYQLVAKGMIILLAVFVDQWLRQRLANRI